MASKIRKVEYFYTNVIDEPGSSFSLLNQLAQLGINQLAFVSVPTGPSHSQLTIFPEKPDELIKQAKSAGFTLDGPHSAILVHGDDKLGVLQEIHNKLFLSNINIFASMGVTGGRGGFGYLIYIRPDQFDLAASVLNL